jgi:hypothetical protein
MAGKYQFSSGLLESRNGLGQGLILYLGKVEAANYSINAGVSSNLLGIVNCIDDAGM